MDTVLDMRPQSIVALFQTDKAQRQSFVTMIIDSIENGEVDPLQIHLQVKCMEDIIAQMKENSTYRMAVLTEAERNGKSFNYLNSNMDVREVGSKYDYSRCNDTQLAELMAQRDELDKKVKARQKFLQLAPIEGTDIVDDNGEVCRVYPPAKTSTTSVVVTLK